MYDQVLEFHRKFNLPVAKQPDFPSFEQIDLRWRLLREEVKELEEAHQEWDIVEVADALGDILYIVIGTAIVFGIDIEKVFNEIHSSNMSKLGEDGKPIFREDGKVLKGPNYFEPNIEKVLLEDTNKL